MIKTSWCVITGAPSSGKTTLINELAQRGYSVAEEVARSYIEKMLLCRLSLEDIHKNVLSLQRKILALKLIRERKTTKDSMTFFDRGIPDSIAYFRLHKLNPKPAIKASQYFRYEKIFYCEPLPFVQDGLRTENEAIALILAKLIYSAYQELGYKPIILPPTSVSQRLEIIENQLP